nr:uncharacterized protein LOC113827109 [Penaeus vannamei]
MRVKIYCGGDTGNIISATKKRNTFWSEMNGVMQELEEHERVIAGADLSGHGESENDVFGRVHGGLGVGKRNPEAESILVFTMSGNSKHIFQKEKRAPDNFQDWRRCSQIDYCFY